MSLAIEHKRRALAKVHAKKAADSGHAPAAAPLSHDGDVVEFSLDRDLERLGALTDVADKVALKKNELLPKYLPIVQEYLDSGAHHTNPLLVRCAIWAMDIDDIETAMRLADAAIKQQQILPVNFKRDLPTFMAESVADWAERQLKKDESGSPYIDDVCERLRSNEWPSANVIARGKVFKIAGLLAEKNQEFETALALFQQAQTENDAAGCKTRIEKLKAKLGLA